METKGRFFFCLVVSQKRFEEPNADSELSPPTPVSLFPRRNEVREEAGVEQEPVNNNL